MTQQKKTEAYEVGELPDLTVQQSEFVRHVLAGQTASDAYRNAYNTENMLDSTIWAEASRLRHNQNVAAWLAAAKMAKLGTATVTLADHLQELESLRELGKATGNIGAAVNAEVSRGKAAGHYVDKVADVTKESDLAATLKEIAAINPDIARQLAERDGIDFEAGATKH